MPRTPIVITTLLLASLTAPSALAAAEAGGFPLPKGPFETPGEIGEACKAALGTATVTTSEGEQHEPRLYFVRRCINSVTKREENRKRGERRAERRTTVHSRLDTRSKQRVQQSTKYLRSRLNDKFILWQQQHATSPRRASDLLRNIRSENRSSVRAAERTVKEDRKQNLLDVSLARQRCRTRAGQEHSACVKEELLKLEQERSTEGESSQ